MKTFQSRLPLLISFYALILTAACLPSAATAGATPWLPFELAGGHVVMPARINGVEGRLVLDSGSTGNMVSRQFVNANPEGFTQVGYTRVKGVDGIEKMERFNARSLDLYGLTLGLENVTAGYIGGVELLLGLEFFSQFIVQIDYPNRRIRLIESESLDLKSMTNVRLDHARDSAHPVVEVEVNDGESLWLTLDTGNAGGVLVPRSVAESLEWLGHGDVEQGVIMGVTGSGAVMDRLQLPYFRIGPYELENVAVVVPAEGEILPLGRRSHRSAARRKGRHSQGLLGYDVLKHFVVTIDYRKKRLHLGLSVEDGEKDP